MRAAALRLRQTHGTIVIHPAVADWRRGLDGCGGAVWQGDGLVHPDFTPDGFEKASTAEWLQAVHEKEQAACDAAQAAEAANDDAAADADETAAEAPAAAPSAAAEGAAEGTDAPPFQYILDVAPELQGRLRMRCWCEGELRPSAYSAEAKLTKWLAKSNPLSERTRCRAAFFPR